ncbi:unnamed protein product [Lampetra planeri]
MLVVAGTLPGVSPPHATCQQLTLCDIGLRCAISRAPRGLRGGRGEGRRLPWLPVDAVTIHIPLGVGLAECGTARGGEDAAAMDEAEVPHNGGKPIAYIRRRTRAGCGDAGLLQQRQAQCSSAAEVAASSSSLTRAAVA